MNGGELVSFGSGICKGLYHLNGNSNDDSGNGFNGTDTSVSYGLGYGKLSQGVLTSGGTSNIDIGAHLTAAQGTILWWMKPVTITDLMRPWSDVGGYLYVEFNASNQVRALLYDGAAKYTGYVDLSTSSRDQWGVTWDSSTLKLYKNGFLSASVAAGAIADVSNSVWIGGITAVFANVEVDEFILLNAALTQIDMAKYYTYARGGMMV